MPETLEGRRERLQAFSTLIRNPTYRWFFAGSGASLIGTWSQAAAVRWLVYEISGSERTVGLVDAAETLPGVAVGLAAGAVADRVGPRMMLSAMQVGQAILAVMLALLVGSGSVQIWLMALLLGFASVFVTFEEPSRQVFQRRLVGRSALGHAIALETGLFNASRVIGPALAGLCLSLFGLAAPFVLNALSFLAALAILTCLRTPPRGPAEPGEGEAEAGGGMLAGLLYVWRDRRLLRIFALLAFFGAAGMGYTALVPAYARRVLRVAEAGYSALLVGGGIGSVGGALLVAALAGWGRRDLLVPIGMAAAGVALAGAGILPGLLGPGLALPAAVACMFANGMGSIVVFATAQTLIQAAVPDAIRGRVMGLWMVAYAGSFPLGAVAAGCLARPLGLIPVMVGSAAICVAAALAVLASGSLAPSPPTDPDGAPA